jgi:hypothetical protein
LNFNDWKGRFFNSTQLNDSSVSGPLANPEKDGVPNLLKYLFNIDPTQPMDDSDRAALPVLGVATNGDLTLTFREYTLETGITINLQTSSDMRTWTTVAVVTLPNPTIMEAGVSVIQTGTDSTTNDPIIQAQVPVTGTRQFIRLDVTQP